MGEASAAAHAAEPAYDAGWVLAAAEAAMLAGQFGRARRLLHDGDTDALDAAARGRLMQLRARLALLVGDTVADDYASLAAALDDVAAVDRALAARMQVDAGVLAIWQGDFPGGMAHASKASALAAGCGDGSSEDLAAMMQSMAGVMAGDVSASALSDAYRKVLSERSLGDTMHLLQIVVVALGAREQYRECVRLCGDVASRARELGGLGPLPIALCLLSNLAFYVGDWTTTSLAAAEALQIAERVDQPTTVVFARVCLALVAAVRDQAADCTEHVRRAREIADATGLHAFDETTNLALGSLAMGAGDYDRAATELVELVHGVPTIMWPFLSDHAEALIRLGRVDEALESLERVEQFAVAADNRWARAGALRCRALLAPPSEADTLLARAIELQDNPFERARIELCRGERLLDVARPHDARAHLEAALSTFMEMDAAAWGRRAQAMLADLCPAVGPAPAAAAAVATAGPLVTIRALGGFAVERDGIPVQVRHGVPTQALKVVVVNGGRVDVETLADTLWPGAPAGRTRLRTVVGRVRRLYGDVLERVGDEVVLRTGVRVDALEFQANASAAVRDDDPEAARRALAAYVGELLPVDRYYDWTASARERLHRLHLDVLDLLAAKATSPCEAAALLERACEADRYDDQRLIRTARLWAQAGRHGRAAELLRRAATVAAELGAPPPPTFDQLLPTS